jgi:predicted RNase H-like HicB family nuclease
MKRYPVIIEQTTTGYSAYSPDVPGCAAIGDTPEETRSNFQGRTGLAFRGDA